MAVLLLQFCTPEHRDPKQSRIINKSWNNSETFQLEYMKAITWGLHGEKNSKKGEKCPKESDDSSLSTYVRNTEFKGIV